MGKSLLEKKTHFHAQFSIISLLSGNITVNSLCFEFINGGNVSSPRGNIVIVKPQEKLISPTLVFTMDHILSNLKTSIKQKKEMKYLTSDSFCFTARSSSAAAFIPSSLSSIVSVNKAYDNNARHNHSTLKTTMVVTSQS